MVWAVTQQRRTIMADEVEEVEGTGLRSQMWKHEAMVEWLSEVKEYGDLSEWSPAEVIAIAFAHRNEWRRTDTYRNLVESHAAEAEEARAAKAAAREEEKAAKAAEREAAKAEKEAAKAAAAEGKETAKATKPAAGKATKAPAKAVRKASKATAKRSASTEDPFEG
jgi:hypothetical protein